MRAVLDTIVRLSLILAIGSVPAAVAIGRYCGVAAELPIRSKAPAPREVNGYLVADDSPGCRFLDGETGRYVRMDVPNGDLLLFAQGSPWRDQRGDAQVVGRWMGRSRSGEADSRGFGIARYTYPSGKALDRVALDVVPSGMPSWFPDLSARVIYAGTDGRLYQLAFEDETGRPAGESGDLKPEPLSWRCTPPGLGRVHLEDPVFLTSPMSEGRLLVALSRQAEVAGERVFLPSELWWLQVNPKGNAIVAAGRLIAPDARSSPGGAVEERLPSVATTPDGTPVVAYLARRHDRHDWQIRLVSLGLDPKTSAPRARAEESILVAEKSAAVTPTFSSDGRWLNGILLPERSKSRADRFSVVEALKASGSTLLARSQGSRRANPGQLASGRRHDPRKPSRPGRDS